MTYTRREELAEGIVVYQADCLELLPTLGRFDAVVTDPPYGIDWKPRVNHADQHEHWRDNKAFDPAPFLAVGRYHLFWGCRRISEALKQPDMFVEPPKPAHQTVYPRRCSMTRSPSLRTRIAIITALGLMAWVAT